MNDDIGFVALIHKYTAGSVNARIPFEMPTKRPMGSLRDF
jgi:hypothetical protein